MQVNAFINRNNFGSLLIDRDEVERVKALLLAGRLFRFSDADGEPENIALEKELAQMCYAQGSVTVSNGTAALRCALFAAGVTRGDRVLVSAYTFIGTVNAIIGLGAIPEPVDVDENIQMDPIDLSSRIRQGIGAIVPVHIAGRAQDINGIVGLANQLHIAVVEDACQAFGARFKQHYAGTMGHLGAVSFQENKLLTCGEGGAVFARNEVALSKARRFSDHGAHRQGNQFPSWDHEDAGFGDNLRLTELQASILRAQIRRMPAMILKQRTARNYIMEDVKTWACRIVEPPDPHGDTGQAIIFLAKDAADADITIAAAQTRQVLIRRIWPKAYYQYTLFDRFGLTPEKMGVRSCPNAEEISSRLLCVPIPPTLSDSDVQCVSDVLKEIVG